MSLSVNIFRIYSKLFINKRNTAVLFGCLYSSSFYSKLYETYSTTGLKKIFTVIFDHFLLWNPWNKLTDIYCNWALCFVNRWGFKCQILALSDFSKHQQSVPVQTTIHTWTCESSVHVHTFGSNNTKSQRSEW